LSTPCCSRGAQACCVCVTASWRARGSTTAGASGARCRPWAFRCTTLTVTGTATMAMVVKTSSEVHCVCVGSSTRRPCQTGGSRAQSACCGPGACHYAQTLGMHDCYGALSVLCRCVHASSCLLRARRYKCGCVAFLLLQVLCRPAWVHALPMPACARARRLSAKECYARSFMRL